jgi:hypothetical protein
LSHFLPFSFILLAVFLISPCVAETTQKTGSLLAALKIPSRTKIRLRHNPREKGGHRDAKGVWALVLWMLVERAGSLPGVAAGQGRTGD